MCNAKAGGGRRREILHATGQLSDFLISHVEQSTPKPCGIDFNKLRVEFDWSKSDKSIDELASDLPSELTERGYLSGSEWTCKHLSHSVMQWGICGENRIAEEARELMDQALHAQNTLALTRKAQRPTSASDRLAIKVSTT